MDMAGWVPQEANSELNSKVQDVSQGIAFEIYSYGQEGIKTGVAGDKSGGSAVPHCEALRAEVIDHRCSA